MPIPKTRPIFFDPGNKRWPRIKAGAFLAAALVSAALVVLVFSVLVNPALESLSLPSARFLPHRNHTEPPLPKAPAFQDARLAKLKRVLAKEIRAKKHALPLKSQPADPAHTPQSIGFFVNWDDASLSSLKKNCANIDLLIPEWLHLTDAAGGIREDSPDKTKEVLAFLRENKPSLPVMPLVNNFIDLTWRGDLVGRMLADDKARGRCITSLLEFVQQHGLAGISIDFENLPPTAQKSFLTFLTELTTAFHAQGLTVSVNVPSDDPIFAYKKIADLVDQVIVMAYDEHWSTSKPGPVASLPWYVKTLRARAAQIPPQKLVVALGSYAYDWPKGKTAEEKTFEEAILTAKDSEATISLDRASENPHFDYQDEQDVPHSVWLMDATTVFNAVAMAMPLRPAGFALWRLGGEDPSIWTFYGQDWKLGPDAAKRLEEIRFDYDLDYEGQGEILAITQRPHVGRRNVTFDTATGLITAGKFRGLPLALRHRAPRVRAQGPGPDLRRRSGFPLHAPDSRRAGQGQHQGHLFPHRRQRGKASRNRAPHLCRRPRHRQSHLYPSQHRRCHPDTSSTSKFRATDRLLESVLGRRTHLFRSPTARTANRRPRTRSGPCDALGGRGYVFVANAHRPRRLGSSPEWPPSWTKRSTRPKPRRQRDLAPRLGRRPLPNRGGPAADHRHPARQGLPVRDHIRTPGHDPGGKHARGQGRKPTHGLGNRFGFFLLYAWSAGSSTCSSAARSLGSAGSFSSRFWPCGKSSAPGGDPPLQAADPLSVAVVVPAYNEGTGRAPDRALAFGLPTPRRLRDHRGGRRLHRRDLPGAAGGFRRRAPGHHGEPAERPASPRPSITASA